jgi:succinyl-CoA synthetase beta subunit
VKVPIVIRLTGTNEAEAIRVLNEVGMTALSDMDDAVARVVQLAKEAA